MRRNVGLALATLAVVVLSGCADEGGTATGDETDLPVEAAAVVDRYFAAMNEHDGEAFLDTVNLAVYEYVSLNTSVPAEAVAFAVSEGDFIVDRYDEIAVQLEHTVSNTVLVAVSARRPNVEPNPVHGIMVLELNDYPDRGWLVTRDQRFGM